MFLKEGVMSFFFFHVYRSLPSSQSPPMFSRSESLVMSEFSLDPKPWKGSSLVVQWLGLCTPDAGGPIRPLGQELDPKGRS